MTEPAGPTPRQRVALCNEVLRDLPFRKQCEVAAALGYDGLELAPFTLAEDPLALSGRGLAAIRTAARDAGLAISGLHWLLVRPEGLSITSDDDAVRARTLEALRRFVTLCAELDGTVMVHGSPQQRRLAGTADPDAARGRALDLLAAVAREAERAGIVYCLEPLPSPTADFVTTVEEAAGIVRQIGSPAFHTMLDCSAAALGESEPVPALLERWLPSGAIAHIQANDPNLRGPGEGALAFAPILRTLHRHGYDGWIAVEPFEYVPDGPTCAARAIGYLRGILEGV